MYKCWNCGTEHEGSDEASYSRGYKRGYEDALLSMNEEKNEN